MSILESRLKKLVGSARTQAVKIIKRKDKLDTLINASGEMLGGERFENSRLSGIIGKIKVMIRLVKAYAQGEYRLVPWKSILSVTAGLVYFLNPFDLIPDFIPVSGFIDDFTVLMLIANSLHRDIKLFEEWEEGQLGING